ncbi:MAG: hypothetical protein KC468_09525, partial [Myxococcales bacterium]|nr:hypothetical protein [Myxococcales bacterium]
PNDDASDEPSDAEADAHDEAAPARRYSIAPTSIRIQGPIDREMARRVFKRHRRSLEACAARVAAAGDDPRGTLALQLHLTDTPDAVRAVVVTEDKTRSRGKLASCVKQRLREWSWPTSYVCGAAIMHVTLRVR